MIPWAMFFGLRLRVKPVQNRHCTRNCQRRVLIQTLNDLSDEWTEYPINDRLSFIRFFGLRLSDRVPDAKTVRLLRERLTQAGAIERGLLNTTNTASAVWADTAYRSKAHEDFKHR